jgi:hypothetical protein
MDRITLLGSSKRQLAIKCNGYGRIIEYFEINFSRKGRNTKRRKMSLPGKGKGLLWNVRSATSSQIAG